jgi:hypothetical protein
MSTKSTIWYGVDSKGKEVHIYWELAERIPRVAAPIYLEVSDKEKEVAVRLPADLADKIRAVLEDPERTANLKPL